MHWAYVFCAGSLASGVLWGGLCLGLPIWGLSGDYVLLTLVGAGMTAGALTTIVAYLPAFLAYSGAFVIPLTIVSVASSDRAVAADGWLMIPYVVLVCFAARNLSRAVDRTIELQVDNEALNFSLTHARVERDAARIEKWSTLGQLSHELRTPLNAIIGFSEAMHEELFGPLGNARYKEYADHVHSSGQHLLTLTSEFLLLSQGESGTLKLNESTADISALVRHVVGVNSAMADKAGLKLDASISSALPTARVDETKVIQIVINLVSNAIKFTPPGGTIR